MFLLCKAHKGVWKSLDDKISTDINVLASDMAAMKSNVSEQLSRFENVQMEEESQPVCSPPRKSARRFPQKNSYASALSVSSSTMVSPTLPTPPKRDLSSSPSSSVKLKIRVDNRSQSAEIMKEINKSSTSFPKYVSKSFDKSLEILTESYSQATEAKNQLLEKIDNLDYIRSCILQCLAL